MRIASCPREAVSDDWPELWKTDSADYHRVPSWSSFALGFGTECAPGIMYVFDSFYGDTALLDYLPLRDKGCS